MKRHALAVHQYVRARDTYRRYSRRTRPIGVAEAFESAKRRLRKVGGEPNCPSPHLTTDPKLCSTCFAECYRKETIVLS
jgi:hypothetical protein